MSSEIPESDPMPELEGREFLTFIEARPPRAQPEGWMSADDLLALAESIDDRDR